MMNPMRPYRPSVQLIAAGLVGLVLVGAGLWFGISHVFGGASPLIGSRDMPEDTYTSAVEPDLADSDAEEPKVADKTPEPSEPTLTPEEAASRDLHHGFLAMETEERQLAFLDLLVEREDVAATSSFLAERMREIYPQPIQEKAVEVAFKIAFARGNEADVTAVFNSAVDQQSQGTRRMALQMLSGRATSDHVDRLIEVIDGQPGLEAPAMSTLARVDDPRAREKIRNLAADENLDRGLRMRAIALIAVTKDEESLDLLRELANSNDDELRKAADTVIRTVGDWAKSRK